MNSNTSYDKIKHLVEIEDDILAVFTINSKGEAIDLTIAKNVEVEKSIIDNIFTNFSKILELYDKIDTLPSYSSEIFGRLKWKVTKYEKLRILQIIEKDKIMLGESTKMNIVRLNKGELVMIHPAFRHPIKLGFPKAAFKEPY